MVVSQQLGQRNLIARLAKKKYMKLEVTLAGDNNNLEEQEPVQSEKVVSQEEVQETPA